MNPSEWLSRLSEIEKEFEKVKDQLTPYQIYEIFLSKRGKLTLLLKELGKFGLEDRKELGKKGNALKDLFVSFIQSKKDSSSSGFKNLSDIDITLPPQTLNQSLFHPITITLTKIVESFTKLGFSIEWGPLIEKDFYNFEALNFPPYHPARDMQDTFYIDLKDETNKNYLLRTHTSSVQIRTMLKYRPPLRVISFGKVFRSESVDATHSFVFHQIEGFYVDKNVSMAELKWTLEFFIKDIFGSSTLVRFSPSYFPFVEPGAQVEVSCVFCGGKDEDCKVCRGSGWIEMLGAGVIHPQVLKNCNYDPDKWSGFAFGAGIERFAMLVFGIDDMRIFYENDLRILRQIY